MADTKISALTAKSPPVDNDAVPIFDSAQALPANQNKKVLWSVIKSTLKTYFDGLYPSGSGTSSGTNTGDETAARIAAIDHAASSKTPPVDADEIPLNDSAATPAYSRAKLSWANLKAALNSVYLGIGATAAAVTGFSPTSGKTLTVSKTMTLTAPDDTAVATLPAGATTLLNTLGDMSGLVLTLPANLQSSGPTVQSTAGVALSIGSACFQGPDDRWYPAVGNIPAVWVANHAYAVGSLVRRVNNLQDFFFFASAIAGTGTSAAVTEPTWPTTIGNTVVDNAGANQITWTCIGTQSIVCRRIACGTINAAATGTFLVFGYLRNDAWSALTPGTPLWLDPATPGAFTVTMPSTVGNLTQIIGRITGAAGKTLFFNPDWTNVQI